MNRGIFIDAHMLQDISDALDKESGSLYDLIYWILDNCGIAITPLILSHWEQKISENNRLFWEWFLLEYGSNRRIREIPLKKFDAVSMRKIVHDCHLPINEIHTKGYIKGANSTVAPRYILTEHMYFYEPKYKERDPKIKRKTVASRNGKLCRFLEKTLNIRVGSPDDCMNYFSISSGSCPSITSTNCPSCQHIP